MQTLRLTTEYLEEPRLLIQNMKRKMNTITIPSIPPVDVPVERQAEYLDLLDTVHARCLKLEPKLAIYLALFGKVNPIIALSAIIYTVAQQKSFEGARFIITFNMLQRMLEQLKRMTRGFGPEWAC